MHQKVARNKTLHMTPEEDFLSRELGFVRLLRKTRRPEMLHLVEPAVAREREIFRRLGELQAGGVEPIAIGFASRDGDPGAPPASEEND